MSYKSVARFREGAWRGRGAEYRQIKRNVSRGLLALVEKEFPGFSNLIEFEELSTPLSVEHFTAHPGGGIYGIPTTPDRFRKTFLTPKTFIPGLYLTGADAGTAGIQGALMGGVATASQLLGPAGFFRIMAAAQKQAARSVKSGEWRGQQSASLPSQPRASR